MLLYLCIPLSIYSNALLYKTKFKITKKFQVGGSDMSNEILKYCGEPDIKSHSVYNDYEIRWNDKLGSGVSGPVRVCIHKESGQEFALKILLDKEKSRKEVGLHWRCSASDYIVRIVDVFANNIKLPNESIPKARLLVVMEKMRGGELFEYITSNQCFTEREASILTYQIARAIKHCHSLNIAHRDIKPENLLLSEKASDAENVHLKLGDFGFAKVDNGDLRTPQFTPYYVAPQVLEAQRRQREQRQSGRLPPGSPYHYDKSCDMWSLGVIIYIMLCGYPPFYSEIPHKPLSQTMQNKIMSGNYEFPPSEWSTISLEAKNLIRALLHVDPAERMGVDDLLQHKWLQSSQVSELVLPSPQIMLNRIGLEETKMAHSTIVSAMRRKDSSFQLKPMEKASNNLLSKRKVQLNIGNDDKSKDNMIPDGSHVKQIAEMGPQLRQLVDLCTMPPPTPSTDHLLTDSPHVVLVQDSLAECYDKPFYQPLLQALEQESWNGQYFTGKVDWHRLGVNVKNIF